MDMDKGRIRTIKPILFILLLSTLAACNGGIPEQPATVISEPANIESVSLIALGQTPVRIHASIQGTYPNDCTLVYEQTQEWVEEVYEIRILTKRPVDDGECSQGPIDFEEIYEIPVYQIQAGEYVIDVNGVQEPLVFVFDNE
jgi:hypothetical protein